MVLRTFFRLAGVLRVLGFVRRAGMMVLPEWWGEVHGWVNIAERTVNFNLFGYDFP